MIIFAEWVFTKRFQKGRKNLEVFIFQIFKLLSKNLDYRLHNQRTILELTFQEKLLLFAHCRTYIHNLAASNERGRAITDLSQLDDRLIIQVNFFTLNQQVARYN